MPWWAYTYLAVFILSTMAGVSDDMKRPHKFAFITGEVVSAIFVCVFIYAFFNLELASKLGSFIYIMVGLGMCYEIIAAARVAQDHKSDSEFTEKENVVLNNIVLVLGHLFIVPGYVFGLMAGLRSANV